MIERGDIRTCVHHGDIAEHLASQKSDIEWIKKITWWVFCGICGLIISMIGYGASAFWIYHQLAAIVCVNSEKIVRIEASLGDKDRSHDSRLEKHRNMLDDHEKRIGDLEGKVGK